MISIAEDAQSDSNSFLPIRKCLASKRDHVFFSQNMSSYHSPVNFCAHSPYVCSTTDATSTHVHERTTKADI